MKESLKKGPKSEYHVSVPEMLSLRNMKRYRFQILSLMQG